MSNIDVPAKINIQKPATKTSMGWRDYPLCCVLKAEQREFGSLFVPIGRFFEDKHILGLDRGRRTHDPFDLRLRHTVGYLVVIVPSELRTGERVSIAGRSQ